MKNEHPFWGISSFVKLISVLLAPGICAATPEAAIKSSSLSPQAVMMPAPTNKIENPLPDIQKGTLTIELQSVAEGLTAPLGLISPDDQSGRTFVYDQSGVVQLLEQGSVAPTPFLDVHDRLVPLMPGYDERGLLGVAFHPNFAQHPFVYTHTSEPNGPAADFPIPMPAGATNDHQDVIAEWRVDPSNTNRVDPASRRELLRLDKPQFNHNGGTIRFGPDGFLYLAFGDGGAADDQETGICPAGTPRIEPGS
jgi:glucose/arabinose dehydrogenase